MLTFDQESQLSTLEHFVDTWADCLLSAEIGHQLTCNEAEALARLLNSAGRRDAACTWLVDHAACDDPDDKHHGLTTEDAQALL